MIRYSQDIDNLEGESLKGFFVDWPNPPSVNKHLEILKNSQHVWIATDDREKKVVGFITAISDGVLSAYVPLLEVLPEFKNNGIGTQLVNHMLKTLKDYYMVDLICDRDLVGFYKKFDFKESSGMIIRHYDKQSGS